MQLMIIILVATMGTAILLGWMGSIETPKSIGDVTAELNAVKAEAAEVDASTATADDTAALKALADRIAAIPEGNLTAAQKTDKQAAANKVAAAQQAIAEAKTKLDEAKAAADAISTKATADDSEALAAAAAKLAAVPAGNLTDAQKTQLQTATEKVTQLQKTIADIASTVDTTLDFSARYLDGAAILHVEGDYYKVLSVDRSGNGLKR